MIKLLLAEDEPLALLAMEKMVRQIEPRIGLIRTAENGSRAVAEAETLKPQIAILDIEMPVMSGLDAAAIIRRQQPDCHILFLTAFSKFEYAVGAVRVAASDYLVKPVPRNELREKLSALCDQLEPKAPGESDPSRSPFYLWAETYIAAHYPENISLEQAADGLGQSPYYFSRLFKQEFGRNFIDYLTDYRLSRAERLLLETGMSAREIGEAVGYPDPTYFTKVFKRNRGTTPTSFRQNRQK